MTAALERTSVRLLVLLLGAGVFLNYVDRGAIGIAAPLMTTELKLDGKAFGFVLSAFFWVYSPAQLMVGWLVDRFSVYRLLALGTLLWAVSTLLMGLVGGFASLLVLRIMLGIGETVAFPGASKIITRYVPPERRGIANSALALGIALGPAVGTLAGGLILVSLGWRPIFFVFGVVTLLWLVPWQLTVRTLPAAEHAPEPRVPIARLIRRWPLWSMSIAQFSCTYVFYFLLGWLPLYLTKSRGLPNGEMIWIATLGYAAQAVAALGFGVWSDRLTRDGRSEAAVRRAMMFGGQVVAAVSVFALPFAQTPALLTIALCVAGVATGALSLNNYAIAQMFSGRRAAGSWVGVQNAMGNMSGIVGPIATGFIVVGAGFTAACWATAAVAAFGALWWIWGVPRIAEVEVD